MDARIRITRVVAPDELAEQIEPSMRNMGVAIAVRAQRLVPKLTWALHDTIDTDTEIRGGTVVTQVGAGDEDVDYATYVERGTSRMAAQPYLRPAMLQVTGSDFKGGGKGIAKHGVLGTTRRSRRRADGR